EDLGELPLTEAVDYLELTNPRKNIDQFVKRQFEGRKPDEHLIWLTEFQWGAIFTTNYDDYIEQAYRLSAKARQTPVPMSLTSESRVINAPHEVPIYHLHGSLFSSNPNPIILSSHDYAQFRQSRSQLFSR